MTGLTTEEVAKQKKLGLSNEIIDSYSPGYFAIFFRNIFNLINIVVFPLLIALAIFHKYYEIFAFTTFLTLNTAVSIVEEVRVKKKLNKLKSEFQIKTRVIRDGKEITISTSEVVMGDYAVAKAGEGIIADGKIIKAEYLQLDESTLTGESNYISKEKGEEVKSGSYVVTGECIYQVEAIGKSNYLNKLGSEALKMKERESSVQKAGNKIIIFLVVFTLLVVALNFVTTMALPGEERVLSITTIVTLIIPQTLIFLFTLTFAVSITKLYGKGIIIQKGGSIEDLSQIDTICFDKTGTITTNEMNFREVHYVNSKEDDLKNYINIVRKKLVGINKTLEVILNYYTDADDVTKIVMSSDSEGIVSRHEFDQIPFTSRQKYSFSTAKFEIRNSKFENFFLIGAPNVIGNFLNANVKKEVEELVSSGEKNGMRVVVGIYAKASKTHNLEDFIKTLKENDVEKASQEKFDSAIVYYIEEELNPGIEQVFEDLKKQGIETRIISGDSENAVKRILERIGITNKKIIDISKQKSDLDWNALVTEYEIFTRSKPEDKLKIINALKENGKNVAMVGDGINDVLSLKSSNVSISMESGSKIAREVSDIVLLNNDYSKIPEVFFEGNNIIFNLKITTKMFLAKSIFAILLTIFFSALYKTIPLHPSSTLIFSFLGSSLPSYIVVFTRQQVKEKGDFLRNVLKSSVVAGVIFFISSAILYFYLVKTFNLNVLEINSALVIFVLSISLIYSIYLLWESRKLKSIVFAFVAYFIAMILGISQTILPFENADLLLHKLVFYSLMIIASALVFMILGNIRPSGKWGSKNKVQILLNILISVIWHPIVLLFPFRSYYDVTRLNPNVFVIIFVATLLAGIVMSGSIKVINKLIK